jgi:hypothetical protein
MTKADQIKIPHEMAQALGINPGWCPCTGLGEIDASYAIEGDTIRAVDAGDLADESDDTILVESPAHWEVANKTFSGEVTLDNGLKINFLNNKLV